MRRVICFKGVYSTWFIVLCAKPHRVGDSKRGRGRWMRPLSVKGCVTYVQFEVCVCERFSAQGSKAWPWPWIKLSPAPRLTNTSVHRHPLLRTHAWTLRRHWTSVPHITQTAKHQRGVHHLHRERGGRRRAIIPSKKKMARRFGIVRDADDLKLRLITVGFADETGTALCVFCSLWTPWQPSCPLSITKVNTHTSAR